MVGDRVRLRWEASGLSSWAHSDSCWELNKAMACAELLVDAGVPLRAEIEHASIALEFFIVSPSSFVSSMQALKADWVVWHEEAPYFLDMVDPYKAALVAFPELIDAFASDFIGWLFSGGNNDEGEPIVLEEVDWPHPEWKLGFFLSAYSWSVGFPVLVKSEDGRLLVPADANWHALCGRLLPVSSADVVVKPLSRFTEAGAAMASFEGVVAQLPAACAVGEWVVLARRSA